MSETLRKLYELDAEIDRTVTKDTPTEEINRLGQLHEELFEQLTSEEKRQYTSPALSSSPMKKS